VEKNYRRCISCRKIAPKSSFWRIVRVHPSKALQLDDGIGRSAYLCRTEECLQTAQKKKAIRRSLRVPEDPEIYEILLKRLNTGQQSSKSTPPNSTMEEA